MDTYELIDVTLTDWLLRMRHGLGEPITCVHYNWHRIRMPYQPGDTNTMTTHTHMGVAITNDACLSMMNCKDEFIMSLQNFNHQHRNRKLLQERLLWLGDGYAVGTRTQFLDKAGMALLVSAESRNWICRGSDDASGDEQPWKVFSICNLRCSDVYFNAKNSCPSSCAKNIGHWVHWHQL